MKYHVNENCISCGMCVTVCPEVFEMGEDGFAKATEGDIDGALEEGAREAMEGCPVDAIEQV